MMCPDTAIHALLSQCLSEVLDYRSPIKRGFRQPIAFGVRPYGVGKVAVIFPAGNDVPVNVRYHIAKAGQIDLGGLHQMSQRILNSINRLHQPSAFVLCQLGHLGSMFVQNNPAEPGPRWIVDGNYSI